MIAWQTNLLGTRIRWQTECTQGKWRSGWVRGVGLSERGVALLVHQRNSGGNDTLETLHVGSSIIEMLEPPP